MRGSMGVGATTNCNEDWTLELSPLKPRSFCKCNLSNELACEWYHVCTVQAVQAAALQEQTSEGGQLWTRTAAGVRGAPGLSFTWCYETQLQAARTVFCNSLDGRRPANLQGSTSALVSECQRVDRPYPAPN
jgi:hypothetical protein